MGGERLISQTIRTKSYLKKITYSNASTWNTSTQQNKKSLATECCKGFPWVTDGIRTHDIQNHNLTL